MSTNLERLQSLAQASAQAIPSRPAFDRSRRYGELSRQHPGKKGAELSKIIDAEEAAYNAEGSQPKSYRQARFALEQRHKQEHAELFKAQGFNIVHGTRRQIYHCIDRATACALTDERPSATALLMEAGATKAEANKIAYKRSIFMPDAIDRIAHSPAIQTMEEQKVMSKRKRHRLKGATPSQAVNFIYDAADHAQDRLRISALEARIAALEAATTATSKRLDITEAGQHWHDIAKRMRAEGASYGTIAKATGQSRSGVSSYLLRNS